MYAFQWAFAFSLVSNVFSLSISIYLGWHGASYLHDLFVLTLPRLSAPLCNQHLFWNSDFDVCLAS